MLARITRFIASQGACPAIQLAHAGRKASTARPWDGGKPVGPDAGGWADVVGPSALPFDTGHVTPHALTAGEIAGVIAAFRAAAARADAAGFEMVEIHGAHGYLLSSFLSPLSNNRTDAYGGSFDNRIRIMLETVAAIRQVWPERKPLALRLSATDWTAGGWSVEDSAALAARVAQLGVDLMDCSSGGVIPSVQVPVGPGYQVPLSEHVRAHGGLPTATVGMISAPAHADEIIRNGRADIVLLAREFLRDPHWPIHAAQALGHRDALPAPPQYLRAM